jgi:hypothetical protein
MINAGIGGDHAIKYTWMIVRIELEQNFRGLSRV